MGNRELCGRCKITSGCLHSCATKACLSGLELHSVWNPVAPLVLVQFNRFYVHWRGSQTHMLTIWRSSLMSGDAIYTIWQNFWRECEIVVSLNIKKCNFAQNNVKFCGQIVGSVQKTSSSWESSRGERHKGPGNQNSSPSAIGIFLLVQRIHSRFCYVCQTFDWLNCKKGS